jgi:drug/metabolite transporter (DMT)-like permease
MTQQHEARPSRLRNIAFDLRSIVGVLFTVYGAVCTIWGIAANSTADSRRSGGINVNLWAGIGMLVVAALFFAWVLLRPLPVEDASDSADDEPAP